MRAEGEAENVDVLRFPQIGGASDRQGRRQAREVSLHAQDGQIVLAVHPQQSTGQLRLVGLSAVDDDLHAARRVIGPQHPHDVGIGDDDASVQGEEAAPLGDIPVRQDDAEIGGALFDLLDDVRRHVRGDRACRDGRLVLLRQLGGRAGRRIGEGNGGGNGGSRGRPSSAPGRDRKRLVGDRCRRVLAFA